MNKRIEIIASLIGVMDDLCDVGCDHGYIAKTALDLNKVKRVIVTDISEPSLNKAVNLLSEFYPDKFTAVLTDGLIGVPRSEQVLIAGMGGEEIIKILQKSAYKPVKLVFIIVKVFFVKVYDSVKIFIYHILVGRKRNDFSVFFGRGNVCGYLYKFCFSAVKFNFGKEFLQGFIITNHVIVIVFQFNAFCNFA